MSDEKRLVVSTELGKIRGRNPENQLLASDVVTAARSGRSPLHNLFDWDEHRNSEAYLLVQARNLIREFYLVEKIDGKAVSVREFVSLPKDRSNPGGGYRHIVEVMRDDNLRNQLLESALADLETFKSKYARLTELAGVFSEITKLQETLRAA